MKIAELLMRESLPRKDVFRASEVSSLLKVRPYEIYYWESEFPKLRSKKSIAGKRLYSREDVVLISAIRHLLQDKKLSVEAAKKVIGDMDYVFAPINSEAVPPTAEISSCTNIEPERVDSLWEHIKVDTLDHDQILGEVSDILDEEDDFDELTHKIYQHCGEELETITQEVSPIFVGEMIKDAVDTHKSQERRALSGIERQAFLSLKESQKRLNEILNSLERFQDRGFWHGFNG